MESSYSSYRDTSIWPQGTQHRPWSERRAFEASFRQIRCPRWREQCVQFFTRYLFFGLGLLFFNAFDSISPAWSSLILLNTVYGIYFVANSVFFWLARKQHYSPLRYRVTMWADIALVSFSVLNDPNTIPPSLLVFIMVVLGNGMRYGMRLFAEALLGSFGATMMVLSIRYTGSATHISPGVLFLNLFGGIILVYTYILMARIEASHRDLEQQSRADSLTGLMNRRALQEHADNLFALLDQGERPFVLMFADLDKFKEVNDTHGHITGDRVLQAVASILRRSVRTSDIVARFGGDEFVILLEDMDLDQAEEVADHIHDNVRHYAEEAGLPCSITISIGQAPTHGHSFSSLLEKVDEALYHAKSKQSYGKIRRLDHPGACPGTD